MWNYVVHLVHEKMSHLYDFSFKLTTGLLAFAVVGQLLCAVLFILGYHTRICAQILLAWLVPVTFIMHDLWTIEGDDYGSGGGGSHHFTKVLSRSIPNFPTEFDNEFVHFFQECGHDR